MDYQIHHHIEVWLEKAAEQLRCSHDRDLQVDEKKNDRDLVTEMDKAIEQFLVNKIHEHYPDHQVIGEEGKGDERVDLKGYLWVIDPIDGTLNFVKAKNHFGILIGLYYDGQPLAGYIYDVMNHDLYYGIVGEGLFLNNHPFKPLEISQISESLIMGNIENFSKKRYNMQALLSESLGVRTTGSAAMELIAVIRGEAALYFSAHLQPWDFAAGYCICSAIGYKVSDAEGQPLDILRASSVLFAHPNVYEEALDLINKP